MLQESITTESDPEKKLELSESLFRGLALMIGSEGIA
jgi:hypothetical protein